MNSDIQISELLQRVKRPLLSFEFFPPKDRTGLDRLQITADQLRAANPDFVTVTYGAGGSTRQRTLEVCALLKKNYFSPVVPHLTCVGSTRNELHRIADEIYEVGYRNIMTLRGDPPKGQTEFKPQPDGLPYAKNLVELLKARHSDLCCGVAGYPETHPEAISPEIDIENLKQKLDAGASFVTTQLFFDNQVFFDFVDRCRKIGIDHPIFPGLLPAVSLNQVQRIATMCHATLPPALINQLHRAGNDTDATAEIGIRWMADQIQELVDYGVPGVHLYILNQAKAGLAPAVMRLFGRERKV